MDTEVKEALGQLVEASTKTAAETAEAVRALRGEVEGERKAREALELKLQRTGGVVRKAEPDAAPEFKALGQFVKTGDDGALREVKTMTIGSDPDGGYTVLPMMAETIRNRLFEQSPIARLARKVAVPMGGGDVFEEVHDKADFGASWAGETEARTETTGPDFVKSRYPLHEIYAHVTASQRLLDDTSYAIGAHVANRIADKFARAAGDAFAVGSGVGRPRGVTTYTFAATGDASRTWGEIQYIASGASGAFASSNPADKFFDMLAAMKPSHRARAVWTMNSATAATVRKFKNGSGDYLWTDSMSAGQPPTLLGYPVVLDESLPDVAANSISVILADWQEAYVVVERPGVQMLRDPFTNKPHVIFYARQRWGGGVANSEALKVMKMAAS